MTVLCEKHGRRVHDGLDGECKLCLWERSSEAWDAFPEHSWFDGAGVAMDHRVGRRAYVAGRVALGVEVRIHDMACVGTRPFDFVRDEHGTLRGFPRNGGVVVGDFVEIFPFANVDAGFLGDTVIGRHSKLDRHVHVGHNSVIGENVLLTAHAVIGGHCVIEDDAFVGLNAVIKPRVHVGAGATIGMGAVVLEDVPAGEVWAGNPARRIR